MNEGFEFLMSRCASWCRRNVASWEISCRLNCAVKMSESIPASSLVCVVPTIPPASAPTDEGGLRYVSAAESQLRKCERGSCLVFRLLFVRFLAARRSNVANSGSCGGDSHTRVTLVGRLFCFFSRCFIRCSKIFPTVSEVGGVFLRRKQRGIRKCIALSLSTAISCPLERAEIRKQMATKKKTMTRMQVQLPNRSTFFVLERCVNGQSNSPH